MSELPTIDQEYLREVLIELLETPSPTGFTEQIILMVQ
jgi:putative aminopeptidase FrvX